MKKFMFLSFLMLVSCAFTFAQSEETYKESIIKYGVKVGYDIIPSSINTDVLLEQFKYGYQAGGFLQIGTRIFLQPELYYASYQNPVSSIPNSKIQSLRAPLMLGLRFLNLGIVSAHIMGGPVYSKYLDEMYKGTEMDKWWSTWQVGAGIDIIGFITADVRYNLKSGVDIYDQISTFNPQNEYLNVTVGLKFRK